MNPVLHLTCIECKHPTDLSAYPDLKEGDVIECNVCGITLAVNSIAKDGTIEAEIVDEGK